MYDELVKRLRESKNEQCYIGCFGNCGDCKIDAELEQAADAIERLETDLKDCRNELCFYCGQYQTKHLGSCNGCRWE